MNMQPADDLELLRRYAGEKCERSFAALVNRHLDLVYSAALRQVRSPEAAREVSQLVFVELARGAGRFEPGAVLPAWLYEVTRRRAIDHVRRESHRRLREQIACETHAMTSPASDWTCIEPLLDEAMDSLDRTDRAAILLRFFENKSLREVGELLGTSEDAAQKRVSRAVERLREFFARKRVPVAAAGLAAVISANAVQAAPAGLGAIISASALGAGAAISTTAAITKLIAMTSIQKACIAAAFAATLGAGIYETSQASSLAARVRSLEQMRQQAADQGAQTTKALNDDAEKLAALESENQQLRAQNSRLRAAADELGQMKADDDAAAKDPSQVAMLSWLDRVARLKQRFAQMPDQDIPEMQFLTDKDWLDAANGNLNTEADYRRAMATLRSTAENDFLTQLQPALRKYMAANNGQFPTDVSQLQSYFNSPVDPSILQRYTVAPASTVPNVSVGSDSVITEKAAIDPDFDGRNVVGPNGSGALGGPNAFSTVSLDHLISQVTKSYMSANNGQQPTDPSQLIPYATTPDQQAALQKVIQQRNSGN